MPDANGQARAPNWSTVVGVAKDTRRQGADRVVRIESWLPMPQRPVRNFLVVVSTALPAPVIARSLREAAWAIDRNLSGRRSSGSTLVLLGAFAGLALVLALGLYGVMAYSVSQRTGEFGIRFALGVQPRDVLDLVFSQAARLIARPRDRTWWASFARGCFVETLLFGVNPHDALTYTVVIATLAAAAFVAAWLPARRAARVEPMTSSERIELKCRLWRSA